MAIIENAKYNSLPEQVEENKDNIKKLDDAIAEIDPDAITAVIDQVATNTSDISNIKAEQITQNNNIGLNALAITSEANNRTALIDVDASGNTKVKAQAGKDIDLYSSNKIQVYGDEGADVSDDYGDAVSVLKDTIILETTSHDLILNEDGTLKMDSNTIAKNGHLTFENIYDKDGNPRFIEGDLNITSSFASDMNITYKRWALSGNHLMLVVAGVFTNAVTLTGYDTLAVAEIPAFIYNKIANTTPSFIDMKTLNYYVNYGLVGSKKFTILKPGSPINRLNISMPSYDTVAIPVDAAFRLQFDLIIDNA